MKSFLVITGIPQSGKTTMVRKLIRDLKNYSVKSKLQGFYTEEARDATGFRNGFDVVTLDGRRGTLASTG